MAVRTQERLSSDGSAPDRWRIYRWRSRPNRKRNPVPPNKLSTVASQWQAIDTYSAKQAYNLVYGEETLPKFFSNKVDFGSAVFHPLYLNDWLTLKQK